MKDSAGNIRSYYARVKVSDLFHALSLRDTNLRRLRKRAACTARDMGSYSATDPVTVTIYDYTGRVLECKVIDIKQEAI